MSLPKLYIEILRFNVEVLEGEEVIRIRWSHEGGALMNGMSAFIEETHQKLTMWVT